MSERSLAFVIAGVLCAGALLMFVLERRKVAQRKANGTYVDPSDIFFYKQKAEDSETPER
jgi:hypothetical protein